MSDPQEMVNHPPELPSIGHAIFIAMQSLKGIFADCDIVLLVRPNDGATSGRPAIVGSVGEEGTADIVLTAAALLTARLQAQAASATKQ